MKLACALLLVVLGIIVKDHVRVPPNLLDMIKITAAKCRNLIHIHHLMMEVVLIQVERYRIQPMVVKRNLLNKAPMY